MTPLRVGQDLADRFEQIPYLDKPRIVNVTDLAERGLHRGKLRNTSNVSFQELDPGHCIRRVRLTPSNFRGQGARLEAIDYRRSQACRQRCRNARPGDVARRSLPVAGLRPDMDVDTREDVVNVFIHVSERSTVVLGRADAKQAVALDITRVRAGVELALVWRAAEEDALVLAGVVDGLLKELPCAAVLFPGGHGYGPGHGDDACVLLSGGLDGLFPGQVC